MYMPSPVDVVHQPSEEELVDGGAVGGGPREREGRRRRQVQALRGSTEKERKNRVFKKGRRRDFYTSSTSSFLRFHKQTWNLVTDKARSKTDYQWKSMFKV